MKTTSLTPVILSGSLIAGFYIFIIWGLGDAKYPLLVSFFLAYLLYPIIQRLEKRGVRRYWSIAIALAITVLIGVGLVVTIVPHVYAEIRDFVMNLPANVDRTLVIIEQKLALYGFDIQLSQESIKEHVNPHLSTLTAAVVKNLAVGVGQTFSGVAHVLLFVMNIFMVPLFFVYLVNDFENIKKELRTNLPRRFREKISAYLELGNRILSGYVRGQLLVALALAGLYGFGLVMIGLKYGFVIGLIAGILSLIPYVGFSIGILLAIISGIANHEGTILLLLIVGVFVLVQSIEGFYLTPRLVGNKVGLKPLATILALVIGGNILGMFGMFIAIPCAALLLHLYEDVKGHLKLLLS